MTKTQKALIVLIPYFTFLMITGIFGVSNLMDARPWMACGANLSQGLQLEWKYGSPNSMECLLVEINTGNS